MTKKPKAKKTRKRAHLSKAKSHKRTSDKVVRDTLAQYVEPSAGTGSEDTEPASEPPSTRQMVLAVVLVGLLVIAFMVYFMLRR